jgi:hypothetical protein
LGAGGHSTRRYPFNPRDSIPFRLRQKSFSDGVPLQPPAPRARPIGPIERQFHVPAVGKFKIARLDPKTSLRTAAAFDHVACADGKSAGQTNGLRAHGTSWDIGDL